MIKREEALREVTEVVNDGLGSKFGGRAGGFRKAHLLCGHYALVETIGGKPYQIETGTYRDGKWTDWKGTEAVVGQPLNCVTCSAEAYKRELLARPKQKAKRYGTREKVIAAVKNLGPGEWGPVHQHGNKKYVQVYLGGHVWLAMNITNLMDAYDDPGWTGDEFGWAWVPQEEIRYALDLGVKKELPPPRRSGNNPVTYDALMFGDQDKLREYLGEDDPLAPEKKG